MVNLAFMWLDPTQALPIEPDPRYVSYRAYIGKSDETYTVDISEKVELESIRKETSPSFFQTGSIVSILDQQADGKSNIKVVKNPEKYNLVDNR